MKKFVLGVLALSLSFLLLVGVLFAVLSTPARGNSGSVEFTIHRGESFASVVERLGRLGIISHQRMFTLWARLWALDKKIKWGLYRFELPMAQIEILNRMVLGKERLHRLMVAEGLTLVQIAALVEREGLGSSERFLEEARNPRLLARFGLQDVGAEGYLFPDTYHLSSSASERAIVETMLDHFEQKFTPAMEEQARSIGLDRHQVVILASVIEKESGVDEERPVVSAVFHNRLKDGIPLQSDPTVIYGLKIFDGNLTRKHLRAPTPYNTYMIGGLPAGPISNPGLASLRAALYPADVPYLYFVSKNDGTHAFSKTIHEHNRAVDRYQRGRVHGH